MLTLGTAILCQQQAHAASLETPQAAGQLTHALPVSKPTLERRFPTWLRLSLSGGLGLRRINGPNDEQLEYDSGEPTSLRAASASLLLSIGRSWITFESGLSYLRMPFVLKTRNENTIYRHIEAGDYVGIPALLKLNYHEGGLGSFYAKGGVIVADLKNSRKNLILETDAGPTGRAHLPSTDTISVVGIGGTTALSDNTAFLLDISHYQGHARLDEMGSKSQSIVFSGGVSFNL